MAHLLDNENQNTALAVKNLCPQIPLNDLVKRFPLVIFYWIANMRIALEDEFALHRYGLTVFPVAGLIGDCAIAVCGPHAPVATSNSPICGQVKLPQGERQEWMDCYSDWLAFARRLAASLSR